MVLSSCPLTATSWSPGFNPPFAPGPLGSTRSAATVSKKSKTATKRAWLSRFMGFDGGSGALGRCEGRNNSPSCTQSVSNFAAMSIPKLESLTSATQRNFENYRWISEHELRLFGCFCGIPYLLVVEGLSLKSWWRDARQSAGILQTVDDVSAKIRRQRRLLEASKLRKRINVWSPVRHSC